MIKVTLNQIGNNEPLNLIGSVKILSFIPNTPIVFLFDEHHDNLNNCIDKNIENAIELINNGNIVVVGVESHTGGKEWNIADKCYFEYEDSDKNYKDQKIGRVTKFFDVLSKKYENLVRGVECEAYSDELSNYVGNLSFEEIPINIERSKHYIKSLFELRLQLNIDGNLILNCGRDHNTHIEEWINKGKIDGIAGYKASYIRLNTFE
jgi:hypothetical protein